ncbi:MAG: ASPIC/UnbV domain-containing protein, partial [Anaerolineales bacterium]|nr:ASPIC/UnbV domain-containing protein [Anaerolineales bacterium]
NRWFSLALVGDGPVNRDAVGTRVTLTTADGSIQVREVQNGGSLGAGNELTLHFGLGSDTSTSLSERSTISQLMIGWPNGRIQQFDNVPTNQRVTLPYPVDAAAEAAQLAALYPAAEPSARTTDISPNPTPFTISLLIVAVFILAALIINQYQANRKQWPRWGAVLGLTMSLLLFGIVWVKAHSPTTDPHEALAQLLKRANATVPERLPLASTEKVSLGRALFWDPLLSGNRDTACVTCHHPLEATGDSLSLPIGTGGQGLGTERVLPAGTRQVLVPRNATPIFNLALAGMDTMFWDGRVQGTSETEYDSPANDDLPFGLDNAVAVQAMFPVTSRDEMRGQRGNKDIFGERNELASISDHQWPIIWQSLMVRILAVPAYRQLFAAAYPDVPADELGFEHAANAIAAYQMETFTFLDSPWDRYLQGDKSVLPTDALAGATLFYGKAGCAQCHSGPLLSDMDFHNIGVPQVGPGKGFEEPFDYGRARETGDDSDLFAFRTPPLRNVAITGPWMHNGAYTTLETAVRHHLDPEAAVATYDFSRLSDMMLEEDSGDTAVHTAALSAPSLERVNVELTDDEVALLLTFLHSLTSPAATDLSHTIPNAVPSGLKVGGN